MERRQLGATDLHTSVLGFGCAALGSRTARKTSIDAVAEARDLGVDFFDTAPFYGQGESERIVGAVCRRDRTRVVIATKVGLYPNAVLRLASRLKPVVRSALKSLPSSRQRSLQRSVQGFMRSQKSVKVDRKSIVRSVDASLRRLGTDYIDLLLLHVTPAVDRIDDVVESLNELRAQGKIRYFGASSHSDDDMRLWLERAPGDVCAVQAMLNLFAMPDIDRHLPLAMGNGVAVIAREPFARGRLVPRRSADGLGFVGHEYDSRFDAIAVAVGRTVPQLALQFLAQTPGISVVLAGMSTRDHLRENVRALALPPLTQERLSELRTVAAA